MSLIYNHRESKRLDAIVDSGASFCLFHADVGTSLGINVTTVQKRTLHGVVSKIECDVYYHKVKIKVLGNIIQTVAGFSPKLSVAAILGRIGFFDNFRVAFNPDYEPPGMEIERVYRA